MGALEVELELFAYTTGMFSDRVVKLIDVYPNDIPEAASQSVKPSMAGHELATVLRSSATGENASSVVLPVVQ